MLPSPTRKWYIFSLVATGVFMSTMDSSMVNIALPSIMKEFQSPLKSTQWVVLIYLLTITSSLLIWGHLSDRIGRKKVYSCGLFIFAAGSLICASAGNLATLVAFRLCQALGAAMMMSTGPAIIKDNFPVAQLGRSLGMIGVAVSLGLMIGPAVGGFLLQYFSWRAIFFITVPLGFVFAIVAWLLIPEQTTPPDDQPIRWRNGICWIAVLTAISFTITYAASPAWEMPTLAILLCLTIAALLAFIALEKKTSFPFLPPHLLNKRFFATAIISAVLSFMVLFSVLILTPFYLDMVLGYNKSTIGLIMMTLPAAVLFVAPAAGWMADFIPAKKLSTLGLTVSTLALFWFSTLTSSSSAPEIAGRLILLGIGQALFLSPNSTSVLHRVEQKDSGKSAAMLATARNMGMLLGIGQASLVFAHFFSRLTGGLDMKDFSPIHNEAFMTALHNAILAAALTGLAGVFVSWFRGKESSHYGRK